MKQEIIKMKDRLNKLITNKGINSKEVLAVSRELDKIILEFYLDNEESAM